MPIRPENRGRYPARRHQGSHPVTTWHVDYTSPGFTHPDQPAPEQEFDDQEQQP